MEFSFQAKQKSTFQALTKITPRKLHTEALEIVCVEGGGLGDRKFETLPNDVNLFRNLMMTINFYKKVVQ